MALRVARKLTTVPFSFALAAKKAGTADESLTDEPHRRAYSNDAAIFGACLPLSRSAS